MKKTRFIVAGAATLSLLAFANCQAEEPAKQSASSRQSSKARDYATRQDKEGPADVAAASSSGAAGQKDGDKTPVLDTQVIDKAAKDTGDNWKKMDKLLDRF
jgi:hypothetical protein